MTKHPDPAIYAFLLSALAVVCMLVLALNHLPVPDALSYVAVGAGFGGAAVSTPVKRLTPAPAAAQEVTITDPVAVEPAAGVVTSTSAFPTA